MKKQAVFLSGGVNYQYNYSRYGNDLGFAYKVLTERCNYCEADITILYSFGNDILYDGNRINTCIASKSNLKDAIDRAILELDEDDEFVLIVSNHGDNRNDGLINLWNQKVIYFDELAILLKQIRAKKIIILGECYAGNFIRDDIPECCILAGNERQKCTYVHPQNTMYDEFLYNLLSFLYGKYPDTDEIITEACVDIEKAYIFALQNDAFNPQNPQYFSGYNKSGEICIEIPQMFCNIADVNRLLK